MYTVSEDFGGFAAGFPHPWIRFVLLFPPRFFCSWVTAWVKTPPRWKGTDRILVEEFNDNRDKIDTAIKGSADTVAAETAAREAGISVLQTALTSCGNCKIVTGSYTGNGNAGAKKTITLNFPGKPLLVVIHSVERFNNALERMLLVNGAKWGFSERVNYYHNLVTWGDTSVSWYDTDENYIR